VKKHLGILATFFSLNLALALSPPFPDKCQKAKEDYSQKYSEYKAINESIGLLASQYNLDLGKLVQNYNLKLAQLQSRITSLSNELKHCQNKYRGASGVQRCAGIKQRLADANAALQTAKSQLVSEQNRLKEAFERNSFFPQLQKVKSELQSLKVVMDSCKEENPIDPNVKSGSFDKIKLYGLRISANNEIFASIGVSSCTTNSVLHHQSTPAHANCVHHADGSSQCTHDVAIHLNVVSIGESQTLQTPCASNLKTVEIPIRLGGLDTSIQYTKNIEVHLNSVGSLQKHYFIIETNSDGTRNIERVPDQVQDPSIMVDD